MKMRVIDFKESLALQPVNLHKYTSKQISVGVTETYKVAQNSSVRNPYFDAALFYTLNQLVALRLHSLPDSHVLTGDELDIAKMYLAQVNVLGRFMFAYLTLICTRESRHVKNTDKLTVIYDKSPEACVKFHKKIPSGS